MISRLPTAALVAALSAALVFTLALAACGGGEERLPSPTLEAPSPSPPSSPQVQPTCVVPSAPIAVGSKPWAVAVNPETNRIYVANEGDGTVSVIDGANATVVDTVAVGYMPWALAVNPETNRIYVVNGGDNSVSVIDGATDTVVATLTVGDLPKGVAVSPSTNRIYVANSGSNDITLIDGANNEVLVAIPMGQEPSALAVRPEGERLYVANLQSFTVSIVDGGAEREIATLPVDDAPQAVAVNSSTALVYVANGESATVSVIDAASDTVVDTIPVGGGPISLAVDPGADRIYVVNAASSTISVVEGATASVVATMPIDGMPWAVAVNPETKCLYVAQRQSNTVLVIDARRIGQTSPAVTIGIDVVVDDNDDGISDNTATSLGTIDPCLAVRKDATFDIDIVITGVADLKVWNMLFRYDPSVVNIIDRDVQMLLAASPGSQVEDRSYGDPGLSGAYDLLASDVSEEPGAHESGSGVLARLTLTAVASGITEVTVADPFLFPFQSVDPEASAVIAVDEACPR
ncbi:MAG: hypothetical protein ACUVX1_12595 [Chloroflexota bacterium]